MYVAVVVLSGFFGRGGGGGWGVSVIFRGAVDVVEGLIEYLEKLDLYT